MAKDPYTDELLARLKFLLKDRSQSEVARKTGTSQSSIAHYLNGRKVPAEFCAALAEALEVNPTWLLVGEGAPYLSHVSAEDTDSTADMLDLVQAMSAVEKMKLGALAGKEHLKALRKLNDALVTYQELREQLEGKTSGILRNLIKEMKQHLAEQQYEAAESLERAASEVSQLSSDPELGLAFLSVQAAIEFARGNVEKGLELQRQHFRRTLSGGTPLQVEYLLQASQLAFALQSTRRIREARQVCAALLALCEGEQHLQGEEWQVLRFAQGIFDIELGAAQDGFLEAEASYVRLSPRRQSMLKDRFAMAQLLKGYVSFAAMLEQARGTWEAMSAHDKESFAQVMLRFAAWGEDRKELADAITLFGASQDKGSSIGVPFAQAYAVAVKAALAQDASAATGFEKYPSVAKVMSEAGRNKHAINANIAACHVRLLLGQTTEAHARLVEAERLLGALEADMLEGLLWRALHMRNALALAQGEEMNNLRKRATDFFEEHYRRGVGAFRGMALSLANA